MIKHPVARAYRPSSSGPSASERSKRRSLPKFSLLVGILLVPEIGCNAFWYLQRGKQIRTHADLQTLSMRIEARRAVETFPIDVGPIVAEINGGRDGWGNPVLHRWGTGDVSPTSYVLVSTGADGKLDTRSLLDYFSAEVELVAGQFDRDIVFRDGEAIRNAGK